MSSVSLRSNALSPRYRHKFLILGICCTSLLIVSMDSLAINVALPSIQADFGSSLAELQWTIDAYTLVLASLLILSGSTADRIGRRRTFQLGLVIFTTSSLLCSIAPSVGWLIAFRAMQAVGGSMLNPVAMSIITHTFDDAAQRAKAVGAWSAVTGISMAVGPIVGGILTTTVGWRGIFWINIPIGVAAIVLTALFVPESRSGRHRRFDALGQLLVIVMLAGLAGGLIEGPHLGWTHPITLALFGAFLASVAVFIPVELHRAEPLIDLRFFRSVPFSSALLIVLSGFAAYSGFIFLMTLYLQEVRHLSPLEAGLHLLPMAAAQIVCSNIAGHLVGRNGTRLPLLLSASALFAVALALTFLEPDTPTLALLAIFLVFGIAQGFLNAPVTTMAVSGMPRSQSGSAAAITSTARQVGTSLGVALAGALTGIGIATDLNSSFAADSHRMWWTILGLAIVIAALAWIANSPFGQRSRDRIASLLLEEPAIPAQATQTENSPSTTARA
jgi:EmrB/QacA subfamily drug resistance transporter